jgi:uncharacterized surface protein with fasciclin (FAS1) repeats
MKRFFRQNVAAAAAIAVLFTATLGRAAEEKDIVDTAVAAGSFKTLAAALGAADLVEVLKGDGPFTVFAPTDEAFAQLPKGTVEGLLKPENKDQLIAVLTYHVVAGKVAAEQVVKIQAAKTINGQRVDIQVDGGKVMVDGANVVTTDIQCSNGIIHVIDRVILPSSDDIVAIAKEAGTFKTLLAAAKAAGLAEALSGKGPLTVFAPTDEAFAKLPKGTVASLLKPENKAKLAAILKYHVVAGRVYSGDAVAAKKATTLQGGSVRITVTNGKAKVNNANLIATDIDASNGVIHVIDSVILPPEKKVSAAEGRKMIEHAVARGSHLYNSGHHSACANVYMTTMRKMVGYGDRIPAEVRVNMEHVLKTVVHTSCPTQRSWTLRRGLDHAYARMSTY